MADQRMTCCLISITTMNILLQKNGASKLARVIMQVVSIENASMKSYSIFGAGELITLINQITCRQIREQLDDSKGQFPCSTQSDIQC